MHTSFKNTLYKMFCFKDSCILWWDCVNCSRYSSTRTDLLPLYPGQLYKVFCVEDEGSKSPPTWRHIPEDGNLHHHRQYYLRSYTIRRLRNNPHTIFSFPKHPNLRWGPNSLILNSNRGRFPRRSSNQKREAGHSPPPSILLPSPTYYHDVYTNNVSNQS